LDYWEEIMGKIKLIFIVLFVSILAFPNLVQADNIFIPAFEFQYTEDDNPVDFEATRGLTLLQCPSYKPKTFYAQVVLPDRAQITSMVIFYKDNSSFGNLEVNMARWNMYSEGAQVMASFESRGYFPTYIVEKISPIKYSRVNNGGYIYRVRVEFTHVTANVIFSGIKIIYN
jgi:hypothetical protein